MFVDLQGTWKKPIGPMVQQKTQQMPNSRALSVILTTKEGNYYLRLTGPEKTVSANTDAFRTAFGADAKTEKDRPLARRDGWSHLQHAGAERFVVRVAGGDLERFDQHVARLGRLDDLVDPAAGCRRTRVEARVVGVGRPCCAIPPARPRRRRGPVRFMAAIFTSSSVEAACDDPITAYSRSARRR